MCAVMGGTETLCHHCCPIGLSSLSSGSLLWAEEVNSAGIFGSQSCMHMVDI